MAYLVEQAGGKSVSEDVRTLDIVPKDIHQRAHIVLGSSDNVDDYTRVREECKKRKAAQK